MGTATNESPNCLLWSPATAKSPAYLTETWHLLLFAMLVFSQGYLHFPEHIAQVIQRFYLGTPADGMIGELNIEWVHVTYNWGLLLAMIPLMVGCGFLSRGNSWKRCNKTAWAGVVISFWVQVWHAFEHYAKLAQYYRNLSANPPVVPPDGPNAPGLVGHWILVEYGDAASVILLHFIVNFLVFLPLAYAFFAFDFPGAIADRLRGNGYRSEPTAS
ncbi:MAG: hypothetical protein DWQ08_01100 [Proteobacteria bacterium]|nr:MAG: hypothetical protein DWQ08_01100 [Pseudomonadota bacterium]